MLWGIWEKVKTVGELEKNVREQKIHERSYFVGTVTEGYSVRCYKTLIS